MNTQDSQASILHSHIFKPQCFANKCFLVSGGSSGIGADIALSLNALGAKIIAIGRDSAKLESKRKKAINPHLFIPISKDISQFYELDKWALNLAKEYGSFDGAVLSVENALEIFNINYFGNLQLIKGLLDRRAKSNIGASFIWISSNARIKAQKGLCNYSASKAGVNASVRSLALEIAPKYRINAISPGFTMTEMIENWSSIYDKDYIESMDKSYPLGIGKPSQITPLVCFLLSEDSTWITGQNIIIDGGGSL